MTMGHAPWGDNRLTRRDYGRARLKEARQDAARLWGQAVRVRALPHPKRDGQASLMALELGQLLLSTLDLGDGETGWRMTPDPGVTVMLRMIRGGFVQIADRQQELPAGQIAILRAGTRFDLILPQGGRQDIALLRGFDAALSDCTVLGGDLASGHHLAFLAGYLLRCAPHPHDRAIRLCREFLDSLGDVASDLAAQRQRPVDTQFERFGFLINANLGRHNLTIADIADSMGISIRQLQRQLAAQQTSFRRFLNQRRLELAKEIIASSPRQLRISEVAYRCGFTDPNYFSRAYSRQWRVPPSGGGYHAPAGPPDCPAVTLASARPSLLDCPQAQRGRSRPS